MTTNQAVVPQLQQAITEPEKNNLLFRSKNKAKRWISKYLVFLVQRLNNWDRIMTDYTENPNSEDYEDLGPTSHATKNETYEAPFLWSLKKKNVTNIAITGPYGSGKSSVIATFQEKHKEFRYLNVSLATFDKEIDKTQDWRQKVELSILQQLIYHVKNDK